MANIVFRGDKMLNNKKIFLIIAVGIILIFAYFNQNLAGENDLAAAVNLNPLANVGVDDKKEEQTIIVHLSGAVKNAGVYELKNNLRLVDLIKLAGGLKEKADLAQINLAEDIYDGQKIVIPELLKKNNLLKLQQQSLQLNSKDINSSTYNFERSNNLININQASQADLEKLNGIGASKASAIIKYREDNGHFSKKEELLKVSGIGEKTLTNIEAEIRLR